MFRSNGVLIGGGLYCSRLFSCRRRWFRFRGELPPWFGEMALAMNPIQFVLCVLFGSLPAVPRIGERRVLSVERIERVRFRDDGLQARSPVGRRGVPCR